MLVPAAVEARAVRVASRSAETVAPHAELLAGATMAAGARRGVDARLHSVLAAGPARWVRASRRRAGDVEARVAVDAGALGVAGRAETWVGARLVGMAGREPGAMEAGQADLTQRELPGQRGDGPFAVTRCALPIGMAAGAQVALARRADAVLADEVAVVNRGDRRAARPPRADRRGSRRSRASSTARGAGGTRSRSPSSARPIAGEPRPPGCDSARSRRGPRPCGSGARSEAARARAPLPDARTVRRGSRCTSRSSWGFS